MAMTIPTNGKEALHDEHPQCNPALSTQLLEVNATLPSQQKAVDEYRALEAAKRAAAISLAVKDLHANTPTPPPSSRATSPVGSESSDTPTPSTSRGAGKKRAYVEDSNEEDDEEQVDDTRENARTNQNPACKFVLNTMTTDTNDVVAQNSL
jgi:hypothetical protein